MQVFSSLRFRRGAQCVRLTLGIVVTIYTAACAPSPDRSGFTVGYYRTHREERSVELARCANDPGTVGRSSACVNAREAERLEGVGSLRELPPLDLPPKPKRQDTH